MIQNEKTFALVKPDGVSRRLIGEIISRFEQRGLRVVALGMFRPTTDDLLSQYPATESTFARFGEKAAKSYAEVGVFDLETDFGTTDLVKIGQEIHGYLIDFMMSAPLVKMVIQGPHAIAMVRKIVGTTLPFAADMGTIRGDYSCDSAAIANHEKRVLHNVVHASENAQEAENEIAKYFPEGVFEY